MSRKTIFRTLLLPALLIGAPSALVAAPQAQTHELLRMPAGKTVMVWREVNRQNNTAATKCHPDPTKSFHCNGRSQADLAATTRPERLSER